MSKAQQILEAVSGFKGVKETNLGEKSISFPMPDGKKYKITVYVELQDWTKHNEKTNKEYPEEIPIEDDFTMRVTMGYPAGLKVSDYIEDNIEKEGIEAVKEGIFKIIVPLVKRHKELDSISFDKPYFYLLGDDVYKMAKELARKVGGTYKDRDWKQVEVWMPKSRYLKHGFHDAPPATTPTPKNKKKSGLVARFRQKYGKPPKYKA